MAMSDIDRTELRDQIAETIHCRICEHSREDCIENLGKCERATDSAMPIISTALEKAEAAVNRVRALHAPISKTVFDGISFVPHDTLTDCGWCDTTYPCPTVQALDGGGSDE